MALKTSEQLVQTYCIKCNCMGDYMTSDGEYFILSGDESLDKKALSADRSCHCATCWHNGGCETVRERTDRICFHQIKCELLKNGFLAAKKADDALEIIGADMSDLNVQNVVFEAEGEIARTIQDIMRQ